MNFTQSGFVLSDMIKKTLNVLSLKLVQMRVFVLFGCFDTNKSCRLQWLSLGWMRFIIVRCHLMTHDKAWKKSQIHLEYPRHEQISMFENTLSAFTAAATTDDRPKMLMQTRRSVNTTALSAILDRKHIHADRQTEPNYYIDAMHSNLLGLPLSLSQRGDRYVPGPHPAWARHVGALP